MYIPLPTLHMLQKAVTYICHIYVTYMLHVFGIYVACMSNVGMCKIYVKHIIPYEPKYMHRIRKNQCSVI